MSKDKRLDVVLENSDRVVNVEIINMAILEQPGPSGVVLQVVPMFKCGICTGVSPKQLMVNHLNIAHRIPMGVVEIIIRDASLCPEVEV